MFTINGRVSVCKSYGKGKHEGACLEAERKKIFFPHYAANLASCRDASVKGLVCM